MTNGLLCADCGQDHEDGGDALRCSVRIMEHHQAVGRCPLDRRYHRFRHPKCRNCEIAEAWLADLEAGAASCG